MPQIRRNSFLISKLLILLGMAGFFHHSLPHPAFPCILPTRELRQQLVKIEPVNPIKDEATTIY